MGEIVHHEQNVDKRDAFFLVAVSHLQHQKASPSLNVAVRIKCSIYFSTKNKAIPKKNLTQIVSLNMITYTNWLTGEHV